MRSTLNDLYRERPLSRGYPDLEQSGVEHFKAHQPDETRTTELLQCLGRLVDLASVPRTVAVVGCGPKPTAVREWLAAGFDTVGIEPVVGQATAAAEFLGDPTRVRVAGAETLPFADQSLQFVVMDSVLEHVDSVPRALSESFRILRPGGVLFVYTTNRLRFHLKGDNGEFRVRFFNWLPAVVRESYVFRHLHYDPRLANYTPRPAVHWFTYAKLCAAGRAAGFAQFYSLLDLVERDAPSVRRGCFRRLMLEAVRRRPWLRGLALTQFGSSIFMLKRTSPA